MRGWYLQIQPTKAKPNTKNMKTNKTNKARKAGKKKRMQGPTYKANRSPEEKAAGAAAMKFIGYLMLNPLATHEEARAVHERLNVPASIGLMRWARSAEE